MEPHTQFPVDITNLKQDGRRASGLWEVPTKRPLLPINRESCVDTVAVAVRAPDGDAKSSDRIEIPKVFYKSIRTRPGINQLPQLTSYLTEFAFSQSSNDDHYLSSIRMAHRALKDDIPKLAANWQRRTGVVNTDFRILSSLGETVVVLESVPRIRGMLLGIYWDKNENPWGFIADDAVGTVLLAHMLDVVHPASQASPVWWITAPKPGHIETAHQCLPFLSQVPGVRLLHTLEVGSLEGGSIWFLHYSDRAHHDGDCQPGEGSQKIYDRRYTDCCKVFRDHLQRLYPFDFLLAASYRDVEHCLDENESSRLGEEEEKRRWFEQEIWVEDNTEVMKILWPSCGERVLAIRA